jgi:hypothetical protein
MKKHVLAIGSQKSVRAAEVSSIIMNNEISFNNGGAGMIERYSPGIPIHL